MPKKKKGAVPEHVHEVVEPETDPEQSSSDLNNPNIEEYMPKPQTEWFHMVIKAQVKKVIQQSLGEQQEQFTAQLEQFKISMKKEIHEVQAKSLKNVENVIQNRTKELESEILKIKEIEKKERFKLESNFHKKLQKVEELRMKVDSFEQDQHKSSIQIVGLPESQDDTKTLTDTIP